MAIERFTTDLCSEAAGYALDLLEPDLCARFEEHLRDCLACQDEVEEHREVVPWLALAARPVVPPARVRDRLFREIAASPPVPQPQVWKDWRSDAVPDPAGLQYVPANEADWQSTPFEGITVRRLSVDTVADRVTMLVRMRPGSRYVPHRHHGNEECLVLQGDLHVGDLHMMAGDYQRATAGSIHGVQSTDHGCELLIISSLHDELLEPSGR